MQDCSFSLASALDKLKSYTKPSVWAISKKRMVRVFYYMRCMEREARWEQTERNMPVSGVQTGRECYKVNLWNMILTYLHRININISRIVANSSMHDVKYISRDTLYFLICSVCFALVWMFLHLKIFLDTPKVDGDKTKPVWNIARRCCPWAHFTNKFSIVIKIRWTFHSALIQVVLQWSLWNDAHGTTMSCRGMWNIL